MLWTVYIVCCFITVIIIIVIIVSIIIIIIIIIILLQIIPRNLIFAHSAKVTALTKATDSWDNQSSIISAADNG